MAATKIHKRSTRLYVNGGIAFPLCKAHARLLDLDASRLATTGDDARVTCARCLRSIRASAPRPAPWTIARIAEANTRGGGYFFSRDTMRYFGDTRKSFRVVERDGRVFVVRRRAQRNAPSGYQSMPDVREFDPATGAIGPRHAGDGGSAVQA